MTNSATDYFGPHQMIDGDGCDKARLSDMRLVFKFLNDLPDKIGMHKITAPHVIEYDGGKKPEDWGFSGVVIIAESHISIHTFPEKGFLSVDIYSCKLFDQDRVLRFFEECFKPTDVEVNFVERGRKFKKT